ncbi:sigma-70 family RNA polymerase sigma factor [Verrucomicrobium sp. BvORR034]|jgi:RNA polymerase sigma factor (sigma-70 family)|uniref:RNA polymerase sigma factor n=1 Tax=Verrucomicrobium sp. BvORR034 TaxID=1396418 RepID=UPI000679C274|nr:sigma-70 family RNA polymerase sigma factor [Verrucomicrobium sp. BvORR034]
MEGRQGGFPTTEWTAVVKAACTGDTQVRRQALDGLCRDYWMPLYAFARRMGHDQHDAQDLTQGFFAYLLGKDLLTSANRELGTLRTFLLKTFQRHIGDVLDRERALKRGGGREFISLNVNLQEVETLLSEAGTATSGHTPEALYDQAWAHAMLRAAVLHLADLETLAGRGRQFQVLEGCLNPDATDSRSAQEAGALLQMSEEAVRQTVSRLRKKFRQCLRDRIAATLQDPDDARIDEELHALKAGLRSRSASSAAG